MKKFVVLLPFMIAGWMMNDKNPGPGINNIQVIGSHNSYKQYIDTPLFLMLQKEDSNLARGLQYGHIGLSDQLNLGLRALEIDILADSKGGRYAHPAGLKWAGANPLRPYDPEGLMNEPGFKVLHVQDIDFRSNCVTFKKCLAELKNWSIAHPDHEPVFITMNLKDDTIKRPDFTIPEKFTPAVLDEIDKTIIDNLGTDKLITPDMVRGKFKTLEEAVLHNNWPAANKSKGKFIFILDEQGEKQQDYIKDHPSLKKRILFVNAPAQTPEAAILIINDPLKDFDTIKTLVKKGYIVRTRADSDTEEARTNDKSRFRAACKSGAQIISTDYYFKSKLFKSDYLIGFDGGKYVRPNPVLQ